MMYECKSVPSSLQVKPAQVSDRTSKAWRVTSSFIDSKNKRCIACQSVKDNYPNGTIIDRRMMATGSLVFLGTSLLPVSRSFADDFVETPSGLKYLDIKIGAGQEPSKGSRCSIHWSGYTEGYQGKRFGNSTVKDEPFEFVLGQSEAIPAIEEAVLGMKVGGIRRIQIPGIHPEIGYPRNRAERFVASDIYKYRFGPQPSDLGGQRALDFVLDNPTLQPFNRDLLMDIKLLRVSR